MISRLQQSRHISQRNFKIAASGLFVAALIGFFIYEFKFLRAPSLTISVPARDMTTADGHLDIRGRGDADADITMNGRPLYSGDTGEFTERVYLLKGVNRLDFIAKNRYGKLTTITRYIVFK